MQTDARLGYLAVFLSEWEMFRVKVAERRGIAC